jgi:hypothetical protein
MAAKRHTGGTRPSGDGEFAVHLGADEIENPALRKPVGLPGVADGSDVTDGRTASSKAAPARRGADRGGAGGRGQGAPQARRYAFRRS